MNLDRRKQQLLQVVVVTYVDRAEPVASQYLAEHNLLGVRSATIRNELAEMTDLGYLRQPHTSAGRVPSDLGYRYYVDHLLTWDRLPAGDARTVRQALRMSEGDVEQLLMQTVRVLSSLTRYTAVVSPPADVEPVVRQAHLAQMSPHRLLAVVVLDDGQVVHRFCDVSRALSPAEVTRLSNYLDEMLRDRAASAVTETLPLAPEMTGSEDVLRTVLGVIGRGLAGEEGELLVDAASRMLEQPEFRASDRVEPLVRFLEQRRTAYETLQMLAKQDLTISIGQENPHEAMQEVSIVAARYAAGGGRSGWLGVVGPTRMRYEYAVPAVQYLARALSETLARLT